MFKEQTSSKLQEEKFSALAPTDVARKLSARDMALGLGRKATENELLEYLSRPHGKSVPLATAVAEIKRKIKAKRISKK